MFAKLQSSLKCIKSRGFRKDEKGIAAVEFAVLVPVILALFAGTIEFSLALTVDRRVTKATGSTADLVARTRETSPAELDSIMDLVSEIIMPYDPNLFAMTISNVASDPNDASITRVCWVYQHNGGANNSIAQGGPFNGLPAGIVQAGDSVVVTEARYNYDPLVLDFFIQNTFELTEVFYLKPRLSLSIDYPGRDPNC